MALLLIAIIAFSHLTRCASVDHETLRNSPHEATSSLTKHSFNTSTEASTITTATFDSIASNFTLNTTANATTCKADEFTCSGSKKCLPSKKKCDRHNDCGDWSDESDCDIVCANQTQVMCDPTFNASFNVSSTSHLYDPFPGCYSLLKERCDGIFHCENGADEKGCHGCPFNMYVCKNGKSCYSDANRCNGIPDCTDYTDEINCGFCPENQTLCDPSTSLTACYDPIKERCNRVLDCPSGIDEKNCVGGCDGKISCSLGSGCYSPEERCNGMPDCSDYSDEKNCTMSLCRPDHGSFLCANRRCIRADWVCDRSNDCGDASDEVNCLKNSVITAAIMGSLVCGLLLVIAISCTCKLIALRQAEAAREHEHNGNGHRNGFSSSYHRSDVISSCPRSLGSLFESDQPFFRIEPDPYFYREPPPSYAASVCASNGVTSSNAILVSGGSSTCPSLSGDPYDRNSRRTRRLRRHHQRRRPPSPPSARTTTSDSALVGTLISSSTNASNTVSCDTTDDNVTPVTLAASSQGVSINGASSEAAASLASPPLVDPLSLQDECMASSQSAEKTSSALANSLSCKVLPSSSSSNNLPGIATRVSSRTSGRSLLSVIAGTGSSGDGASGGHANHSSARNRLYNCKRGDEEVSPILNDGEYNEDDEYQEQDDEKTCDAPSQTSAITVSPKCKSSKHGKSQVFPSSSSHDQACTLIPMKSVACPATNESSITSSASSSLSSGDFDTINNPLISESGRVSPSQSHYLELTLASDSSKSRCNLSSSN